MRHPKPPVSAWLIAERKRHGWKVEEVSRRLVEMGYPAEVSTVRVWEAGRSPHPDTIEALETLFGSSAPSEPVGGMSGADLATLFQKMDRQTDAIESVAVALLALITRLDQDQRAAEDQRLEIAALLGVLARAQSREERPGVSEPEGQDHQTAAAGARRRARQ